MGVRSIINRVIRPVYRPLRFKTARLAQQYTHYFKSEKVINDTILYEVRDGQSMTDSPKAIFDYLLKTDKDKRYTHIWSYVPSAAFKIIQARFIDNPRVIFVERNSKEYLQWLCKAQYLINNATFQAFFTTKDEQTYINTWHGTPLKAMGYDMPGSPRNSTNVVRNFYQANYLLSPNAHTSKIFLDSYRLRDGMPGQLLEAGYPRIDQTINFEREVLDQELTEFGFSYDPTKEVLLYAPTWKGTRISASRNDVSQIEHELNYLRERHGEKYNVLVKVHPFLYKTAEKVTSIKPYLVPDVIDTNLFLGLVDVLVTDYSSIFFDFLVTKRPIIFYTWDEDIYANERGNYLSKEELPGPSCATIMEVSGQLEDLSSLENRYEHKYQQFMDRFCSYEDGQATARYVAEIFDQNPQTDIKRYVSSTEKEKIIFFPGGLLNNGITTSFLNLVNSLDPEKYEITCLLTGGNNLAQRNNLARIPKHVHLMFKMGETLYTKVEEYQTTFFAVKGFKEKWRKFYPQAAYEREMRRVLGKSRYDYAIDFSGYSLFWTKFVLAINSRHKLAFLHSDMLSDMNREVNGKKIHYTNLKGMFSLYNEYDQLVSVTNVLKNLNRDNLADYAKPEKFTFTYNTINPAEILNTAADPLEILDEPTIKKRGGLGNFLSTDVHLWQELPKDSNSSYQKITVTTQQIVEIIAESEVETGIYFKVLVDHLYYGWVKSDAVELKPELEQPVVEQVNFFGKITCRGNGLIYSQPLGLSESIVVGRLNQLQGISLLIKEKKSTSFGAFYAVQLEDTFVGWIRVEHVTLYNFYQQKYLRVLSRYLLFKSKRHHQKIYKNLAEKLDTYTGMDYVPAQLRQDTTGLSVQTFPWIQQETDQFKQGDLIEVIAEGSNHRGDYSLVRQTGETEQVWLEKSAVRFLTAEEIAALPQMEDIPMEGNKGIINLKGEFFNYPPTDEPTFVTLGRLSEEKAQTKLVEAFGHYYNKEQKGFLYLIGEGPSRASLTHKIKELELQERVFLLGHINQPFEFLKQCDYFVLTSLYEGQPLAILEALTLGLKVVSTDIQACRHVLADGKYGLLTQTNDVAGIAEGLIRIQDPQVQFEAFDPYTYNQTALEMFSDLLANV